MLPKARKGSKIDTNHNSIQQHKKQIDNDSTLTGVARAIDDINTERIIFK
jgi:hypothetical protein